jgi:hypothetical protein
LTQHHPVNPGDPHGRQGPVFAHSHIEAIDAGTHSVEPLIKEKQSAADIASAGHEQTPATSFSHVPTQYVLHRKFP